MPALEDAIATARIARGLSQDEIATMLGISQAVYSKGESGVSAFTPERVQQIAEKLDLPVEYFTADRAAGAEARIFHRKRASLPVKADRRIRAEAALLQAQYSSLLGTDRPDLSLVRMEPSDDGSLDPRDIAEKVRADWGLGDGPIGNLVDVLEKNGVIVVQHDMKALRIDAVATWPRAGVPVVLLATHASADRQRFTLAHELGHAVMHDRPRDNQEREADEFASEFLMPARTIAPELKQLSMASLVRLKERWGVSMQALARRARDLGSMSERQYKTFSIQMSSTGMRTDEPGQVSVEYPTLIKNAVQNRLARGETSKQIAAAALMTQNDLTTRLLEKQP